MAAKGISKTFYVMQNARDRQGMQLLQSVWSAFAQKPVRAYTFKKGFRYLILLNHGRAVGYIQFKQYKGVSGKRPAHIVQRLMLVRPRYRFDYWAPKLQLGLMAHARKQGIFDVAIDHPSKTVLQMANRIETQNKNIKGNAIRTWRGKTTGIGFFVFPRKHRSPKRPH